MRIEFIGVSGVGKTFTAQKMMPAIKEDYPNVRWPWEKLYNIKFRFFRNLIKFPAVLYYASFHPVWVNRLIATINEYTNLRFKQIIILVFNGIYLKWSFVRNSQVPCVYDEGIAQYIWALHLRTKTLPTAEEVKTYLHLYGEPTLLFLVEASSEIIANRIKTRGRHVYIQETQDLEGDITQMQKICKRVVELFSECCKKSEFKVTVINNES